jgi:pyruvate dehydrogenase E2 component (dihydrolipoamide acetyltransferase)
MPDVTMPRLSDSMEEGTIVTWLAGDGDEVPVGGDLAEIETDKATMAFQSEVAGVLRILVSQGETVSVGTVIGRIQAPGEMPAADAPQPHNGRRVAASPVARRMAQALELDLAQLRGSGPAGRVVKRDVVAAARRQDRDPAVAVSSPAPAGSPAPPDGAKGRVTVRVPTRTQATIARRMAEAKASMPEFTLEMAIDMGAAVAMRRELKGLGGDVVPSFNDFVIRACAKALRAHPLANSAYRDGRFELYERVNIGVAVAAEGTLLVPTLFDADRCSLGEIARETRRLAAAARAGTLTPPELGGQTFSVSNLGMFGVTRFTAVLNPPQAAILAVGALEERPAVRDGELAAGHRMPVTLTCDHRILYGADAAAFLADIRAHLEAPLRLAL